MWIEEADLPEEFAALGSMIDVFEYSDWKRIQDDEFEGRLPFATRYRLRLGTKVTTEFVVRPMELHQGFEVILEPRGQR